MVRPNFKKWGQSSPEILKLSVEAPHKWKWMREEVSQLHCHANLRDLFFDCLAFIDRINLDPERLISRLWPKFDLDPDYEKLLLSI